MPSAALVATQLTDRATRLYTLTVGGLDMNVQGAGAAGFRIPIESIEIDEEGPGGVSSMNFTIFDSGATLAAPADAAIVQFHNVTRDLPQFTGFVQSTSVTTNAIGRWIKVGCVGIEKALDWMVIPSLTIPAGTQIFTAVQSAYDAASGIGVALRALHTVDSESGSQSSPIGGLGYIGGDVNSPTTSTALTFTGATLREAIRQIIEVAPNNQFITQGGISLARYGVCTVDFWFGLRLWLGGDAGSPGDYTTLSIIDTVAGAQAAVELNHERDASGVVRGVFVKGGNAAGTGLITDGSGIPGEIAYIEDSSILTSAARDDAAVAYLSDKSVVIRGDLTWERATDSVSTPTSHWSAGGPLLIDDTQVGVDSGTTYFISAIRKTFHKTTTGLMVWRISYGGLPPSWVRKVRRLTRAIRS